jgi:hypothetical protein
MINSTTKQPYLTVRELKEILARHDDDLIVQVQCHKYTHLFSHPIVEAKRAMTRFSSGAHATTLLLIITDGDPKTSDSIEDNE